MAEFVEAFERGLTNAESAAKEKAEIEAVIGALSTEISGATNGKISKICIKKETRAIPLRGQAVRVMGGLFELPTKTVTYTALVAVKPNKESSSAVELCEFRIAPTGFPVTISYPGQSVVCDDSESLASALKELLEHPDTGEKLFTLINDN